MIVSAHRMRSIGWFALLAICGAAVMVLAFKVNAVRSQVHRAEAKIIALRQEKMYLETEFETRANQQQLKAWNDVEFGFVAPTAGQYLENERQLAALSKPAEPDSPPPIRVASVDDSVVAAAAFPAMVSPLTGKSLADETQAASTERAGPAGDGAMTAASLGERLSLVPRARAAQRTGADGEKPSSTPSRSAGEAGKASAGKATSGKPGSAKVTAAAKGAKPAGKAADGTVRKAAAKEPSGEKAKRRT